MAVTFPRSRLTKTNFMSASDTLALRPEHSLLHKRVLVDCQKGSEAITIAFYSHRGYHCSIWVQDTNCELTGHGKGSINAIEPCLNALIGSLNEIGVIFESPIPAGLDIHEYIELTMHSIADALTIGHPRVITHAWTNRQARR